MGDGPGIIQRRTSRRYRVPAAYELWVEIQDPHYSKRWVKQRLFDITVCLRPFRAQGPRIEAETIGDALVVHNYGHGGSGWSLS